MFDLFNRKLISKLESEIATLSSELAASDRKLNAEKHRAITSGRALSEALKERDEALAKIARMTGGLKRGSRKPSKTSVKEAA
jgi:hypothetical protein